MKLNLATISDLFHFKNQNTKEMLQEMWQDLKIRYFVLASLLLNIIAWLVSVFINLRVQEDVIPLHHNIYFGISLIGSPRQIFFIPVLGLILIIINFLFSYLVKQEDKFFIYLFTASSILINFFLLLGLGSIILINFR